MSYRKAREAHDEGLSSRRRDGDTSTREECSTPQKSAENPGAYAFTRQRNAERRRRPERDRTAMEVGARRAVRKRCACVLTRWICRQRMLTGHAFCHIKHPIPFFFFFPFPRYRWTDSRARPAPPPSRLLPVARNHAAATSRFRPEGGYGGRRGERIKAVGKRQTARNVCPLI
jgi:hypothetical protein